MQKEVIAKNNIKGLICPCHRMRDSNESPIDANSREVAFMIT